MNFYFLIYNQNIGRILIIVNNSLKFECYPYLHIRTIRKKFSIEFQLTVSLTAQTPKDCELKLNGFSGVDEVDAIIGCAVWGNVDDGMNVGVGSGNCDDGTKLGVGSGVDNRSVGCGTNGCGFKASPGNCWSCGYIHKKCDNL